MIENITEDRLFTYMYSKYLFCVISFNYFFFRFFFIEMRLQVLSAKCVYWALLERVNAALRYVYDLNGGERKTVFFSCAPTYSVSVVFTEQNCRWKKISTFCEITVFDISSRPDLKFFWLQQAKLTDVYAMKSVKIL